MKSLQKINHLNRRSYNHSKNKEQKIQTDFKNYRKAWQLKKIACSLKEQFILSFQPIYN